MPAWIELLFDLAAVTALIAAASTIESRSRRFLVLGLGLYALQIAIRDGVFIVTNPFPNVVYRATAAVSVILLGGAVWLWARIVREPEDPSTGHVAKALILFVIPVAAAHLHNAWMLSQFDLAPVLRLLLVGGAVILAFVGVSRSATSRWLPIGLGLYFLPSFSFRFADVVNRYGGYRSRESFVISPPIVGAVLLASAVVVFLWGAGSRENRLRLAGLGLSLLLIPAVWNNVGYAIDCGAKTIHRCVPAFNPPPVVPLGLPDQSRSPRPPRGTPSSHVRRSTASRLDPPGRSLPTL
ncbi:MAG: hypothetical protein ABR548_15755 [Actinomycetota bacterium]|nr:hypothetical protein [Actinomycetota bacterium]